MARTVFDFNTVPMEGLSEWEKIQWYMKEYNVPESQARVMLQAAYEHQQQNSPAAPAAPAEDTGITGGWSSPDGGNMMSPGNQSALINMQQGTMGTQGWDSIQPAQDIQGQTDDLMEELLANIKRRGQFHYGQDQSPEQAVDMLTQLQGLSGGMLAQDETRQMMDFRNQMLGGDGPMTSDRVARYQMMNTGQAPYWYGENIASRENMAKTISQVEDKIRQVEDQLAQPSTRQNAQLRERLTAQLQQLQMYLNQLMSGASQSRGRGTTTTGFASPMGGGSGGNPFLAAIGDA